MKTTMKQSRKASVKQTAQVPIVTKVLSPITIKPDDDRFSPESKRAGIYSLKIGPQLTQGSLPPRNSIVVDAGIEVSIKSTGSVLVKVNQTLAAQGLAITSYDITDDGRLLVVLHNIGRQIFNLTVGTVIGTYQFCPVIIVN